MGKANVISGGTGGQYEIDLIYNVDRITASITKLNTQISSIDAEIDKLELAGKYYGVPLLKLQKAAMQKSIDKLEAIPDTKRISAWAADLSEELSGFVGTAEVPDDPAGAVNILPAGTAGDQAVYDVARDGIINPIMNMGPASAFFLRAIMPGVQKYKPMYRYGRITSRTGDKCNVDLLASPDINQLSVNQTESLSDIDIEYMSCNGSAFVVGDDVLLKFTRDWSTPKVIGFKDNPKECGDLIYLSVDDTACVWDVKKESFAVDIPAENGGFLTFPCHASLVSFWRRTAMKSEKPDSPLWAFPIECTGYSWAWSFPDEFQTYDQTKTVPVTPECPGVFDTMHVTNYYNWDVGTEWTTDPTNPDPLDWTFHGYLTTVTKSQTTDGVWEAGGVVPATSYPKNICRPANLAGYQPFYYGITEERSTEREELYEGVTNGYGEGTWRTKFFSFSRSISARLNTPIAATTDATGTSTSYTQTTVYPDPQILSGSSDPLFSKMETRGEIGYSKKTIIQVYASYVEATHTNGFGVAAEEVIGPLVKSGVVSVETFETDIESEGYDPNGATETPALSQFVKDAILGTTIGRPYIVIDIYKG